MSIKRLTVIGVVALVVLASLSFAAFNWLTTNTTAPSELTAIPVLVNTATAPAETGALSTAAGTVAPAGTAAATAGTSGLTVYQIDSSASKASFTISEQLNGQPNTVVGTTSLVAGQLALNTHDLSQSQVGVIQVDARGLATDNERRDGAIRNFILNTDPYEYITFTPKSISGLSGAGQTGQALTFQITGDLTIRNVTQSVTFSVSAQGASADQITGTAKATVNRGDFNLTIPSVPNVADVGEQVTLQIDFVANNAA